MAAADNTFFEYPDVAVDQSGRLHLIWSGKDGLSYSSSQIAEAPRSAQNWQKPRIIAAEGPVNRPRIYIDERDIIHVLYSAANSDGNIDYLRSEDHGRSWSYPISISQPPGVSSNMHVGPQLVVDDAGRVHVAWFEAGPPGYAGESVWYRHSSDASGRLWTTPVLLAERTSENEIQGTVSLSKAGLDKLVAVWVCGQVTNRCTRASNDGGQTWGPVQTIFGDRASRAGWDAIGTDSSGESYLIVQLRSREIPNAVYYSIFSDGIWQEPPIPIITEGPLNTAHHPQMAVALGNRVHVVLEAYDESEIYYMTATTTATHRLPVESIPNQKAVPTATSEGNISTPEPQLVQNVNTPLGSIRDTPIDSIPSSPGNLIFVGVSASLLIVLGVISVRLFRWRVRKHKL
jgi:hypothetical protein